MEPISILLFDGYCNLCNGSVNFILKRELKKNIRFCSMQSAAGKRVLAHFGLPESYSETLVVIENGKVYLGSTAALRVSKKLRGGWPLLYFFILIPKPIRDWIYLRIGKNRYVWFGRRNSCRMPTAAEKSRFLTLDHPL